MQIPLQIVTRGLPHSDALEARIRAKLAKLDQFHPHVISCRVTVEELQKHRHQGRPFQVRIDVRVPGREIIASRDHDEDVYVALRDAFGAAKRQLEDIVRVRRGDVKLHQVAEHGRVLRMFVEDGCGFIAVPDGRELYFSRDNVVHPSFEQLNVGTEVQFIEEMAVDGPQAKRVSARKHDVPA